MKTKPLGNYTLEEWVRLGNPVNAQEVEETLSALRDQYGNLADFVELMIAGYVELTATVAAQNVILGSLDNAVRCRRIAPNAVMKQVVSLLDSKKDVPKLTSSVAIEINTSIKWYSERRATWVIPREHTDD